MREKILERDYCMNKIVLVINGKAEVGKDTLCDYVIKNYYAEKRSSITPIVEIAMRNGWDGIKTNKSRKFLSDLKRAFIDFNNLPNEYLIEEHRKFLESSNNILFVHIRETDQIDEFLKSVEGTCRYTSLLICNDEQSPISFGNNADDYVNNYSYEYVYHNIKPLGEAEMDFIVFFQKIMKDKGVCPISRKREEK